MAKTAKSRKAAIELGDSGVQILNGIITGDEYRHDLRGRQLMRTIEEMRRGDATIHAGLMAVKQPIIAADYYAESGGDTETDEQAKDLLQYNFTEVLNWEATLTEMLTMLEFGFYVGELVFGWRTVNGVDRVVLEKIAYRKQTTIEKWAQDDGTPGIVQRRSDGKSVSIPIDKLLVLTHQQEGDNWEGVSILRSAYQNWYFKKTLYQIDAMKHERQALGIVKITVPTNAKPADKDNIRRAAMNIRANEQAYVEVPQGYDIEFMDMKANTTANPTDAIAHHNRQILVNMQVGYLDIGSQSSSGSLAASNDQRRLLELQDQAIADQIVAKINETVVKTLIDLNFNVSDYPKWRVGRIGQENVEELTVAVAKMVEAGLLTPTSEDEEHTRKLLRFPDMPDEIKDAPRKTAETPDDAKDIDDQPANDAEDDSADAAELGVDEQVKASTVLAHAREIKKALNGELYGTPGLDTPYAA